MATSISAVVNPNMLVWARRESGYDPEPVAKRLGVKIDKLLTWEAGDRKPTVRQAQELAKFYRRPFGIFFLPEPPQIPPLAAEYRRLPGVKPGVESPELRLAIRTLSHRRESALQLYQTVGQDVEAFSIVAHLADSASLAAQSLRQALAIGIEEQFAWQNEWQAWRRWREAIENIGVLVFQFPKVPLTQARGLSLLRFPLPVIGINSKEISPGARSYTLIHELVHLALAVGNEERAAQFEQRDDDAWQRVERFAEEVASEVLVPQDILDGFLTKMSVPRDHWDVPLVRKLASTFKVTPLAMATRLRAAGCLTWDGYNAWKSAWNDYVASLPPKKAGPVTPAQKALGRAGRPFVQLVLEALDGNRITAVEACHYLELRYDHIEKLRGKLIDSYIGSNQTDADGE